MNKTIKIQEFQVLPGAQTMVAYAGACLVCDRPTKRRDDGVAVCDEHGAVAFPAAIQPHEQEERQPEVFV